VYQRNNYGDDDDDSSTGQASFMSFCTVVCWLFGGCVIPQGKVVGGFLGHIKGKVFEGFFVKVKVF
jgi:hypothetical protein